MRLQEARDRKAATATLRHQHVPLQDAEAQRLRGALEQVRDQSIPVSQRAKAFWGEINTSIETVSIGMWGLAGEMMAGTNPQARVVLSEIISSKIPTFLRGLSDREARFRYALAVALVATRFLAHPRLSGDRQLSSRTSQLLGQDAPGALNQEERLILLHTVLTQANNRDQIIEPLVPHEQALLARLVRMTKYQEFNDTNLRLATAASQQPIALRDEKKGITTFPKKLGENFLDAFLSHFSDLPQGHLEAMKIIARAFKNGALVRGSLIHLLVGKETWTVPSNGSQEKRSLVPLLRRLIAQARQEETTGQADEATIILEEIVENSISLDGSKKELKTYLPAAVYGSSELSDEEKLVMAKVYLGCLAKRGLHITSLSDDEIKQIMTGGYQLSAEESEQGNPVLLSRLSSGEVVGVVGYYAKEETPTQPLSTSANGHADIVEAAGPDEQPLTREERIGEALQEIFPEIPNGQLEEENRRLWSDLDPQSIHLKRIRTLSPAGIRLKLRADHPIAASQDFYPHVLLRPTRAVNGTSDIQGAICLSSDLAVPFAIDRYGGLDGELADLALADQLPFDLYGQLNHRVLSLTHQKLAGGADELLERAKIATAHAEGLIMTDGLASRKKIAAQLARSKPYLIEVTREEGPGQVTHIEVDKTMVLNELRPGESSSVFQQISQEELREGARRKGSARPGAQAGAVVFLPYGQYPRRIAIENAQSNNVALVKVTEFFMDPDGAVTEVVIYTTFRSAVLPK